MLSALKNQAWLSTLLQSIGDGVAATDMQGRITFLNPAAERLTGWSLEEASGKPFGDVFRSGKTESGGAGQLVHRVLATGQRTAVGHDTVLRRLDGGELAVEDSASPIFTSDGQMSGVVIVFRDVTEGRLAKQVLHRQAKHSQLVGEVGMALTRESTAAAALARVCQALVEHLAAAHARAWLFDPNTQHLVLAANSDVKADEPMGTSVPLSETYLAHAARSPTYCEDVRGEDGTIACAPWLGDSDVKAFAGYPLHAEGRLLGALEIFYREHLAPDTRDVLQLAADGLSLGLERRRAEEEREQISARSRLAHDIAGVGSIELLFDASRTLTMDARAKSLFGFGPQTSPTLEEALGRIAPEDLPEVMKVLGAASGPDPGLLHTEYSIRRPLGDAIRVVSWATQRVDADGKPYSAVAVFLDVTAERARAKEREALLDSEKAAREEAEASNRLKDEFLATVSHELRTPLTSILGWAQMLRGTTLPAQKHARALETIERNARSQAQLIEDILDVSRIMSGKLRLEVEVLELARVIDEAVETVRPAAEARGVRLRVTADSELRVMGDSGRMQQIIWNLLSNAVKFTPRGGSVDVLLRRHESSAEVRVTDTGQGISSDFLPHVFGRFRQADASITRRSGGLGLGLSIVKSLIELHGGTVRAESEGPGKGSVFTFSVPVSALRQTPVDSPIAAGRRSTGQTVQCPESLQGLRVLVVEDERDTRELLKTLLESFSLSVTCASSVKEALVCFGKERPDVVLSDIGMPDEDGYSLIRRLRSLSEADGGQTPAVCLTAYARSEDRSRALNAGFNGHVSKPVDAAELLAVLAASRR